MSNVYTKMVFQHVVMEIKWIVFDTKTTGINYGKNDQSCT